jgi:dihydroflavonol-4-reductase
MILVTGGTGLIGSHLLYELMKSDLPVRAIYRDKLRIDRVRKLFDFYSNGNPHRFNNIEWVNADVLDIVSLEDAFVGVTHVYHCAAQVSFVRRDFKKMMKINREGTSNMLSFALANNIQKFGHVSSTAAIGGQENELTTEKTKWIASDKTSGYAVTKYSSEKEVWRAKEEGMDVLILNPSVIFGAGDWNESSLTIFRSVKKGLKFYTPGQNAFVDARDVATIFKKLMESDVKNERFLCISENVKFRDVFQSIAKRMGKKGPTISTPKWLVGFAWRLAGIWAWLTRTTPSITKETVKSAFSTMNYSNEKVCKTLDYTFISVDDAIENALKFDAFASATKK